MFRSTVNLRGVTLDLSVAVYPPPVPVTLISSSPRAAVALAVSVSVDVPVGVTRFVSNAPVNPVGGPETPSMTGDEKLLIEFTVTV